jgi:hypothetical protein
MAQRAELRPKVTDLLGELAKLEGGTLANLGLADLFMAMEDQVVMLVRASVPLDQLSAEEWDAMAWEDVPTLAQAIWELNVARPDGGGILGKLLASGLGSTAAARLGGAAAGAGGNGSSPSPSPTAPQPTSSRPEASAS